MIFDRLCYLARYRGMSPNIDRGIDFLQTADLTALPLGRVEIAGDEVYGNHFTYTTAPLSQGTQFEAHQRYLDLHVVLTGIEKVALAPIEALEPVDIRAEEDAMRAERGHIPMDIKKYQGVIPAFYACYDDAGNISPERTRALARHLLDKGVKGLYVGGSSGECIYHSVAERKVVLENVMAEVGGKLTIIAHVACNNTADSQELARHAEGLGVDAIAAIPPIYFHLPPYGIAGYWNDISAAAPSTDFIIYNIPQLAGVSLTPSLLAEMQKNPKVIGVKNSSMPTQDIQMWKDQGGSNFVVMNGPDEQLVSGLAIGATGGIGGTYAVMPELFLKIWELFYAGQVERAAAVQNEICRIIYKMCSAKGNLYAVMKAILKKQYGLHLGGVRAPLPNLTEADSAVVHVCSDMIQAAIQKFC